jgi:hypothetical protein
MESTRDIAINQKFFNPMLLFSINASSIKELGNVTNSTLNCTQILGPWAKNCNETQFFHFLGVVLRGLKEDESSKFTESGTIARSLIRYHSCIGQVYSKL